MALQDSTLHWFILVLLKLNQQDQFLESSTKQMLSLTDESLTLVLHTQSLIQDLLYSFYHILYEWPLTLSRITQIINRCNLVEVSCEGQCIKITHFQNACHVI